jgi:hypothetical protein
MLLGAKLCHHKNYFKTYPTYIYFYRSRHNERNGEKKLKIDAWQESYHTLKFVYHLQMAKKQIWYTTRGQLPSPHLHPHSVPTPHTPHVCILLYGFSMRHTSVRCYMAEHMRINYWLGLSTSSPSIYMFYVSIQCAATWPMSYVRLTTWTATLDLFPKQRGTMSDLKSLWTKIYNFRDDGPEHNPKSL